MSSAESSDDETSQTGAALQDDLMREILTSKKSSSSQFVSQWEADEADVDEATDEEIQNNPIKRVLWAAENNHADILEEMVDQYPNLVNAKDDDGYTPLHRAAYGNNMKCAELLLSRGADVDTRTNDGWQPLHSAALWNCADAAELLIHNGAELNVRTNGGQTPLHLAASQQNTDEVLKLLLLNSNVDAGTKNDIGETARDVCQRSNDLVFLFELVEPSISNIR